MPEPTKSSPSPQAKSQVKSQAKSQTNTEEKGKLIGGILLLVLCAAAGIAIVVAIKGTGKGPTNLNTSDGQLAQGQTADAILNSFLALQRENRLSEAEAVLKAGVAQYTQEQRMAAAYAEFLAIQRRPEESYAMFERALAIGPRVAALEFNAGTVAVKIGKRDRAIEHYAAAQAQDPTDYRYPLFLAQVQLQDNQIDESRMNLFMAARLKDDAPVVWGTLAEIALRENSLDIALQHITKARALEPQYWLWRLLEARTWKRKGEPQKGLDLLVGLDDADKGRLSVLNEMSECYGLLGTPEEAADAFALFSDRAPTDADLAMQAAIWSDRVKRPNQAVRFAERAANLKVVGAEALLERLTKAPIATPADTK